jgi:hydroxymethylbilane synthase
MIRIVSRKSALAIKQTELVRDRLLALYPQQKIEIIGISTAGDINLDSPLNKIGGKGLFVKELENYLLEDKADLAVHSMKDMPAILPEGLEIAAILARENPHDAFVSTDYASIYELPPNAVIGTSSLRRSCQIQALRKDLVLKNLRGNVITRLEKLAKQEFDAIILACAGLIRLGLANKIRYTFTEQEMLPAVAQGALGIECKIDNIVMKELLEPLIDYNTTACVMAERAMNRALNGGCQAPIAGYAEIKDKVLYMTGLVGEHNGEKIILAKANGEFNTKLSFSSYEEIGLQVAEALKLQGADQIIAKLC